MHTHIHQPPIHNEKGDSPPTVIPFQQGSTLHIPTTQTKGDSLLGFLGKALDPPHDLSVRNAIELLVQIGAFTPQGKRI